MSFRRYDNYKASEASWLGDVPSTWDVRLGRRLFKQIREPAREADEQLSASQRYGVVPQKLFMELEDQKVMLALSGLGNFKHVQQDDFVISLRSFQGGIEHSEYSGCVSPAYTVLRARDVVCSDYFAYTLKCGSFVSALQTTSDGIRDGKNISYEQFGSIPLPLPSLSEQTAIAAFLDCETANIDALVDEQQRLIELLKEKRRSIISHAVTKGLDPKVSMKNSGIEWLGAVPAHWEIVALKHLVSRPIIDGPHESPIKRDEGIPFVSAESVSQGSIDFDKKWGYISPEDHAEYSKRYKPQRGDILLVKLGATTGTPAIVDTDRDFNIWVPLAAIRVRAEIEPLFILHVLRSDNLKIAYELNWTFGTQQTLGLRTISNLRIPTPPKEERQSIVKHLNSITPLLESLIAEARRAICLLQERRAALISAAVTGKIDVRKVASFDALPAEAAA